MNSKVPSTKISMTSLRFQWSTLGTCQWTESWRGWKMTLSELVLYHVGTQHLALLGLSRAAAKTPLTVMLLLVILVVWATLLPALRLFLWRSPHQELDSTSKMCCTMAESDVPTGLHLNAHPRPLVLKSLLNLIKPGLMMLVQASPSYPQLQAAPSTTKSLLMTVLSSNFQMTALSSQTLR